MSGGGGDNGFAAQQASDDAKKQRARDSLNASFGVSGSGSGAPRQSDYMVRTHPNGHVNSFEAMSGDYSDAGVMQLDQAAWDKAQADWAAEQQHVSDNAAARNQLYSTVRTNAFDAGKRSLDEQKTQAGRDLKFELFAKGLNGGSVDIDQNATLGRTYDDGVLQLGAKADGVAADMRSSDEQTRLGLLQSIDAGMDQGSAASSAINQMRVNADKAASSAQGTAVGDLFAGGGAIYNQSVQRRQRQQGQQDFLTQLTAMRSGGSSGTRSTGSNGTITSTGN